MAGAGVLGRSGPCPTAVVARIPQPETLGCAALMLTVPKLIWEPDPRCEGIRRGPVGCPGCTGAHRAAGRGPSPHRAALGR